MRVGQGLIRAGSRPSRNNKLRHGFVMSVTRAGTGDRIQATIGRVMLHRFPIAWIPIVGMLLWANPVTAQIGLGTVVLTVTQVDGEPLSGAVVRVMPMAGTTVPRETGLGEASSTTLTLPPGAYRIEVELLGMRAASHELTLWPGQIVTLAARLSAGEGSDASRVVVADRSAAAYSTTFAPDRLEGLPTGGTAWSLLDVAHPFLISDRIDHGGLWNAEPARLGGHGSSFTQTTFRFDGLDLTDPAGSGAPMLYPDLGVMQAVEVDSAAMPAESGGPGPVITLVPRLPSSTWTGLAQAGATPRSWQGAGGAPAPPIARFDSYTDVSALLAGPLVGRRVGVLGSARFSDTRRLERADPQLLRSDVGALFGRGHIAATPDDQVRITAAATDSLRPYSARVLFADRNLEEQRETSIGQLNWDRARSNSVLSVAAAVQRLHLTPRASALSSGGTIERLTDGPPLALADAGRREHDRTTVGLTFSPSRLGPRGAHQLRIGGNVNRTAASTALVVPSQFAELIDGQPARLWRVGPIGPVVRRSALGVDAHISDRWSLRANLTLTAGLRLDHDRGSADDAASDISWTNVLPRLSARWRPLGDRSPAITSGYGWYRHRLLLDALSVGAPLGSSGLVYRWDDTNADRRPDDAELTLVGPVGACCSNSVLNTIDADLRRPTTREFVIGVEDVLGGWRWRITGIDRREHDQLALVNDGVTAQDFDVTFIQDPGVDIAGNSGFGPLPIYNRRVTSFGLDRYRLTNRAVVSRYQGVEIGIDRALGDRWWLSFGGTAYRSEGGGGNRGYLPTENDQGVLGETFVTPNATTFADGRLFFDRAYVIKLAGGYRALGDVRLTAVSRYQDGQPFSRLVIAAGLNQGAEAIQTYARGLQRFTYTLTVDGKVDKEVRLGRARVGIALEIFNLLDTSNEVEEDVVTGPAFRTISAVQPPRAFRVRLRVGF